MPDLVPKILTGVMGEFWDDVPGRDLPGARAGDGPFAAIRPVSGPVCLRCPEKPRQAVLHLARGTHGARSRRSRCCEDLVAALVAMFNDPKKAFQPTSSP